MTLLAALGVLAVVFLLVNGFRSLAEDPDRVCEISGHKVRECHCAAHSWYLH